MMIGPAHFLLLLLSLGILPALWLSRSNRELRRRLREAEAEAAARGERLRQLAAAGEAAERSLRQSEALQREAGEVMRKSEERFRGLIQNSRDIIQLYSEEGKAIFSSPSVTRVLGYEPEETLGLSLADLAHPEDADRVPAIRKAGGAPGDVSPAQLRLRHKDGSWRWLEGSATNLLGMEAVSAVVVNLRDITDRMQAEEKIRELNEGLERTVAERTRELKEAVSELESFSYSVSHDLRSPLRHIAGFVDLLAQRSADRLDDQGRRYLDIIAHSVKRMDRLISHLLAFSRTGRQAMQREPLDMRELVRQVIAELEPDLRSRRVEWILAELPPARGDAALVRQVVGNLLSNALKFTREREPARIEVGCEASGGELRYYVRDNGVGFDMQYVDKLFGVFQRLHPESEFEGTGIGLANVQRIILRHGGKVWAEGRPGEGACFRFSLPA